MRIYAFLIPLLLGFTLAGSVLWWLVGFLHAWRAPAPSLVLQRLPAHRDYMRQVPRFIPRLP